MESFEQADHGPAGLRGCDRELFAQVWARVAPGESPVIPGPAPTAQGAPGPACPLTPTTSAVPAEMVVVPPQAQAQVTAREEDIRNLHRLSAQCAGEAVEYRAAMGRKGGQRGMEALADTKERHARQLGAAAFLLTGVWPVYTPPTPSRQPIPAFLRTRFWAEQRLADRFTALSSETPDPGLGELYLGLAGETRSLVSVIRGLVETLP